MEDNIISIISCPITHQIFRYPVLAEDGHSYEKSAIENWLSTSLKSPLTNKLLVDTTLHTNFSMKMIVDYFLDIHPEWKERQHSIYYSYTDLMKYPILDILNYVIQMEPTYPLINSIVKAWFKSISSEIMQEFIDRLVKENYLNHIIEGWSWATLIYVYGTNYLIGYMLEKELDWECKYINDYTLFHFLINTPEEYIFELEKCLEKHPYLLNAKTSGGMTPLYIACNIGHQVYIEWLTISGADINVQDNTGKTPFHYLMISNEDDNDDILESIECLLEKGADINIVDNDGNTVLHYMFEEKSFINIIPLLKKYNIIPNIDAINHKGDRPIDLYCRLDLGNEISNQRWSNDCDTLKSWLDEYPTMSLTHIDSTGLTPLQNAIKSNDVFTVFLLSKHINK